MKRRTIKVLFIEKTKNFILRYVIMKYYVKIIEEGQREKKK